MRATKRLMTAGHRGRRVSRAAGLLGVGAVLSFLVVGRAAANEQLAANEPAQSCGTFCAPLSVGQLDKERAQGLDNTVGVILWDELQRRQSPPPPPTSNASGGSDSSMVTRTTAIGVTVILVGSGPH
ncbi:MAG TPA: hypothetical protein VEI03_09300 [Stellaceae bacterium]|nr:hypothetical protein [Stellaceae bacterium]